MNLLPTAVRYQLLYKTVDIKLAPNLLRPIISRYQINIYYFFKVLLAKCTSNSRDIITYSKIVLLWRIIVHLTQVI